MAIFAIPVHKASLRNGYVTYENRILHKVFSLLGKKQSLKELIH